MQNELMHFTETIFFNLNSIHNNITIILYYNSNNNIIIIITVHAITYILPKAAVLQSHLFIL